MSSHYRNFDLANATSGPIQIQFEPYGVLVDVPGSTLFTASGGTGAIPSLFWLWWMNGYYDLCDFRDSWVRLKVADNTVVDYPEFADTSHEALPFMGFIDQRPGELDCRGLIGISLGPNDRGTGFEILLGTDSNVIRLEPKVEYVIESMSDRELDRLKLAHCGNSLRFEFNGAEKIRVHELLNRGIGLRDDYEYLSLREFERM